MEYRVRATAETLGHLADPKFETDLQDLLGAATPEIPFRIWLHRACRRIQLSCLEPLEGRALAVAQAAEYVRARLDSGGRPLA